MLRKILRFVLDAEVVFANGPEPCGEPSMIEEARLDYAQSIADVETAYERYAKSMIELAERVERVRRERYQEEAQINAGLSID